MTELEFFNIVNKIVNTDKNVYFTIKEDAGDLKKDTMLILDYIVKNEITFDKLKSVDLNLDRYVFVLKFVDSPTNTIKFITLNQTLLYQLLTVSELTVSE